MSKPITQFRRLSERIFWSFLDRTHDAIVIESDGQFIAFDYTTGGIRAVARETCHETIQAMFHSFNPTLNEAKCLDMWNHAVNMYLRESPTFDQIMNYIILLQSGSDVKKFRAQDFSGLRNNCMDFARCLIYRFTHYYLYLPQENYDALFYYSVGSVGFP